MGIPNETVMEDEAREERRSEADVARRRRLEKSLESGLKNLELGLQNTVSAANPVNLVQPPATDGEWKRS
jgi:hypothetical protein